MHSTPRHRPQPPLPRLLHLMEEGTTTIEGGWTQVFPIPSHLETIAAVKLSPTPILIVVAPSALHRSSANHVHLVTPTR